MSAWSKVLRFRGYWDDHTLYGARVYFVVHYYLKDNTVEINEARQLLSRRIRVGRPEDQ